MEIYAENQSLLAKLKVQKGQIFTGNFNLVPRVFVCMYAWKINTAFH